MERISTAEKWAWILTATVAPAAQFLPGWTWYWVPAAALAAALLWGLSKSAGGKLRSALGIVALGLILCRSVRFMADGWRNFGSSPVMALLLLALAVWSLWKDGHRCRRACCAMFWLVMLLLATVVLAAVKDVRWERLVTRELRWNADGILVLLLPCLGVFEEKRDRSWRRWALALGVLTTVLAVATWGCLGSEGDFFDLAGSLKLFGVVQRFEPLVAAALTLGWFAFAGYVLTAAQTLWRRLQPEPPAWLPPMVLCGAAAVGMLLNLSPGGSMVSAIAGLYAIAGVLTRQKTKEKEI